MTQTVEEQFAEAINPAYEADKPISYYKKARLNLFIFKFKLPRNHPRIKDVLDAIFMCESQISFIREESKHTLFGLYVKPFIINAAKTLGSLLVGIIIGAYSPYIKSKLPSLQTGSQQEITQKGQVKPNT